MGKNYIQFQSDTKKYEEDCRVKGSGSHLYIFPFTKGTSRDWRKEYTDYLLSKYTGEKIIPDKRSKIDTFWGVFYKPEDMDYNEFCRKVENGEIGMIGNTPIIPNGNDLTRLDLNGNLLVKTINSKLDNYLNCGNMLINGETGEIVRTTQPSQIINSLDDHDEFYKLEIYSTTVDKATGNQYVSGKEYNFLTPEGKLVSPKQNFSLTDKDFEITKFTRNYYDSDNKKVINDWSIYPYGYVVAQGRDIHFYDSPVRLLKEIRTENTDIHHLMGKDDVEIPLLADFYERREQLDMLKVKADTLYNNGKITSGMYERLSMLLSDEYDRYDEFRHLHETDRDRNLADKFKLIAPEQK